MISLFKKKKDCVECPVGISLLNRVTELEHENRQLQLQLAQALKPKAPTYDELE